MPQAHRQSTERPAVANGAMLDVRGAALLLGMSQRWVRGRDDNPVARVQFTKEPRAQLRVLEVAEEDLLLAKAKEPLKSIIVVALHCGLRLRSECLSLQWADVDLTRRILTVQAAYSKSGIMRVVPLNTVAWAALAQLPRVGEFVFVKPDGEPYTSVRTGFDTACRLTGLTDVTPHTLRHTFASRLLASGVDPIMATKLGGWASIKMLDRYAHANPSRMAEAVEKIARHSTTVFTTPEKLRIADTA